MTDVAAIAGRLTKAQREAVLNHLAGARSNTWAVLERLGLIEGWRNRLSPLGLAVRNHIKEQEHDN